MKEYAEAFYKSKAWQNCRDSYISYRTGLCEDCLKKGIYNPAIIVHHIEHITPANIYNPEITLDFKNLKAVCRDCHAKYHSNPKPYSIDEYGRVFIKEPINESKCNSTSL